MKDLRILFAARRGMAVFMASLVLLSLAVLSLSTMNRISETSYLAGEAIEKKRMAILADSALRVALAEINEFVFNDIPPLSTYYVNGGTTDTFKIFYDKFDNANPIPVFAYRARAIRIAQGNDAPPPGAEGSLLAANTHCYDVLVDTRALIKGTGSTIQGEMGVPLSGYFFGEAKTIGATTCFRKR